jgi:hypothetical protein
VTERWFVYRIYIEDELVYIGKGCNKRHETSAKRIGGNAEIIQRFKSERAALAYERKLIAELNPRYNKTAGGEGYTRCRKPSQNATNRRIEAQWRKEAYEAEKNGHWLNILIADCYRKCEQNELRNRTSV